MEDFLLSIPWNALQNFLAVGGKVYELQWNICKQSTLHWVDDKVFFCALSCAKKGKEDHKFWKAHENFVELVQNRKYLVPESIEPRIKHLLNLHEKSQPRHTFLRFCKMFTFVTLNFYISTWKTFFFIVKCSHAMFGWCKIYFPF